MKGPHAAKRIGEILVGKGWLKRPALEEGLQKAEGLLGEWLLSKGFVTEEHLARALAEQFSIPYLDLKGRVVPRELFELFSASESYQSKALPLARRNGTLDLALSDPLNSHRLADSVERRTGLKVRLYLSTGQGILEALERSQATGALLKDTAGVFKSAKGAGEKKASISAAGLSKDGNAVVKLVNAFLLDALKKRASDIHFEAYETGTLVKYRVDGLLIPASDRLDPGHHKALVSRIKVLAELDIAETRIPQDGSFQMILEGREIDFRVSVLPSRAGEDLVLRVLDKAALNDEFSHLTLDRLGFDAGTLRSFRRAIREPYGMALITGPTGSGKTTTLYAALGEINDGGEKIVTIEDPVEYQLKGIVQVPVNEKKGLTFARGLRSILRHDPDKIMVGEIRDPETAQIAVQSALTGHLVFTTVHANNACDVIGRFSHMGINLYSFVSSLNCVMAQRLIRRVCPRCRRKVRPDKALLVASGLSPKSVGKRPLMEGKGCAHCGGTGYRGRTAVAEFLRLTPRLRKLIVGGAPLDELQAAAVAEGMVTLRRSAIRMVLSGETTLQEINRVTFVD
jgi:type IV pilus assembly protein PilB